MMEGNHLFLIFDFQLEPPIKKGEHMRFGGSKVPPSFDRCSHQNDRSAVAFLDHHCTASASLLYPRRLLLARVLVWEYE